MALALYRKYRPRTFAEVIGQDHVTEPLIQALGSGRLNHAYLFSGPRGCGKTSSARILARSLNCDKGPTPTPCGECESCRWLAPDGPGSIDVIEIDAASHGGVDDARELRERAFFTPAISRYKIYIIDEAHMVSSAGFNALLKLVEEPPDYVKFVFATTEPEKVLSTIKSRTHHYPFRLIPPGVLRPYLEFLAESEGVKVEPQVFPLVVRAGGGSARDALSVLDQLIAGSGPEGVTYSRAVALLGVTDVALIDEMIDALAAGDGGAAFATIDRVAEAGHDSRRFAGDLLQRLRDLIILRRIPEAAERGLLDAPEDELVRMRVQAGRLGDATLSRCADIVHEGLVEMRGATSPRLLLELLVARMLLPAVDESASAVLQRLERLESGAIPLTASTLDTAHDSPTSAHGGSLIARGEAGVSTTGRSRAAGSDAGDAEAGGSRAAGAAGGTKARGARVAGPDAGDANAPGARVAGPAAGDANARGLRVAPSDVDEPDDGWPAGVEPTAGRARTGGAGTGGGRAAAREAASKAATRATTASAEVATSAAVPRPARSPESAASPPPSASTTDTGIDAASVRRVWDEIVRQVGQTSKKAAAFAREAVVREIEDDTMVLLFKHKIHADGVNGDPAPLLAAVAQVIGGAWRVRCEIGGEQRTAAPARSASPPPAAPSRGAKGSAASTKSDSVTTSASRAAAVEEWPATAKVGGASAHDEDPPPQDDDVPYDPEFDGPAGRPIHEGFDPGDEPDMDTDSLAVKQTSEEQALESLKQSFDLEKIAEKGS